MSESAKKFILISLLIFGCILVVGPRLQKNILVDKLVCNVSGDFTGATLTAADATAATEAMNRKTSDARYYRLLDKQTSKTADMAADTTEQTLYTFTVPGGTLGATGLVKIFAHLETPNTNIINFRIYYGGTGGFKFVNLPNGSTDISITHYFYNDGTGVQRSYDRDFVHFGAAATTAHLTGSIDSTVNQDIVITVQLTNSADTTTRLMMVMIEFME